MVQGIYYVIMGVVMIAGFAIGYYAPQFVTHANNILSNYPMLISVGTALCSFAQQYLSTMTGESKNKFVANEIVAIAKKAGITLSDEQGRAIAQGAYDSWQEGKASSNT